MPKILVLALAVAAIAACDDSDPAGPGTEAGTLTVDASQGWAYVAFDDGEATEVSVSDPSTSSEWDIAFNATRVMLNGGAAGPGDVLGYCVCQNAGATNTQVMAMTASSELADFEQVTDPNPPQDAVWTTEEFVAALDGWYAYNPVTHVVSPAPNNVFAVRTASGDAFAKLRVIDISGATQAHAGTVTIEYAYQPAAGEAFLATDTVELNASASERLNLATGVVSTSGDWDLALDGWDIRLNGGVSGSGSAGAYLTGDAFDDVVDAGQAPSGAFSTDSYAGVFGDHPWYRYNLDGQHSIFPTFEVYLIDTGAAVYKVQLTGYYSTTGDPRRITFRYEQLD
ncbi:MAG TPA: HmuY family protein [Longimicrobiales bacterium]